MKPNGGSKHRLSSAGLYRVVKSALRRCVRFIIIIINGSLCLEHLTNGTGPVYLRFQKLIPIFFHGMDQSVELHET